MERRKFVIGAGALATGSAAAVGTGAFTSVEADRSMDVQVADDSEAYVAFDTDLGGTPHDNYEYSHIDEETGEFTIEIAENDAGGKGVNPNSVTVFDDVFAVENQGTEDAKLWVELSGDLTEVIDVDLDYVNGQTTIVGEENAFSPDWGFGVGSSFRVSITVDTTETETGELPENFSGTITFHAEAKADN